MELLIVNYHYFRETSSNSGIYPINTFQFKNQLLELKKRFQFISQSDLISHLNGSKKLKGKHCMITFDDGLKEQMLAFELMQNMGIPCVFYTNTDPIEYNIVLPVHKLHYIRANMSDEQLYEHLASRFNIRNYIFDEDSLAKQYRYDSSLSRKVKYYLNFVLDDIQKNNFLTELFLSLIPHADEAAFSSDFYFGKLELCMLAKAGALGSHGASHRPLATLEKEEAHKDISHSIELLRAWTSEDIFSFAYPFGGATAVSAELKEAFAKTSVRFALTMERGINTEIDFAKPYFLKRIDTNDAPGGKNFKAT